MINARSSASSSSDGSIDGRRCPPKRIRPSVHYSTNPAYRPPVPTASHYVPQPWVRSRPPKYESSPVLTGDSNKLASTDSTSVTPSSTVIDTSSMESMFDQYFATSPVVAQNTSWTPLSQNTSRPVSANPSQFSLPSDSASGSLLRPNVDLDGFEFSVVAQQSCQIHGDSSGSSLASSSSDSSSSVSFQSSGATTPSEDISFKDLKTPEGESFSFSEEDLAFLADPAHYELLLKALSTTETPVGSDENLGHTSYDAREGSSATEPQDLMDFLWPASEVVA